MSARERASTVSDSEPTDVARLRAALVSLGDEGSGAVDAERIFDALHGNLTAEERQAIVDQLLANPEAAEAWRLAQELTPPASESALSPPRQGTWRLWSAAAAAVLVLGLAWQFANPWRGTEAPVYRSTEQRVIASSLPAGQPLPRSSAILRWTAIDGARYRITVLTPALEVLAEANDLNTAEYAVSADALARIPPGAPLLWQVEARIPGEGSIVSPTFSVRVE